MKHDIIVAFDVDGCLRDTENALDGLPVPDEEMRMFLVIWAALPGVHVHVWSGSGELYARQVAHELGIAPYVASYSSKTDAGFVPDITFDDEDVTLGTINVRVTDGPWNVEPAPEPEEADVSS